MTVLASRIDTEVAFSLLWGRGHTEPSAPRARKRRRRDRRGLSYAAYRSDAFDRFAARGPFF